ncbi:hypothetical protein [Nocardia sputi]|uniref:hypothetical protein n=1 Tax=Nocardia sputi TaxID=2943705 RepID=UPI0020BE365D|nr:hypothetical protein [Nocardia sputi]
MHPSHTRRIAALTALALTGPIAAGLVACGSDDPRDPAPDSSSTATTVAPAGVRWQPFQGVELPVADEGPRRIDGPVATGFDRGPAGAALAAIHATVRMSIATDNQWSVVGQRMLAPGPGRDAWATARAQISITAPITEDRPKVLGYVITRYTLDATDVDIYSIHPDNSVTRNHTTVVWHGDDWRLQLPDHPTTAPVTDVAMPPPDVVALAPR